MGSVHARESLGTQFGGGRWNREERGLGCVVLALAVRECNEQLRSPLLFVSATKSSTPLTCAPCQCLNLVQAAACTENHLASPGRRYFVEADAVIAAFCGTRIERILSWG
jgi:hypothetical protein